MNNYFLCIALALALPATLHAENKWEGTSNKDSIATTIPALWRQVREHHPLLHIKANEAEMAHANLKQERLWSNPQIDIAHNVNNPVTHRYFETNRDGQTDIQVSQRIYIGGQRSERIHKATEEMHRSRHESADVERLLRKECSQLMIRLWSTKEKIRVVSREIDALERMQEALAKQQEKGNIAPMEIMRIHNQLLQGVQQMAELTFTATEAEQTLRSMAGIDESCTLVPLLSFEKNRQRVEALQLASLNDRLHTRADLLAHEYDIRAAHHDLKLQKALALPEVNLTGEWDKNGSIGRNCFALGISFTLPLFNHNQGNIKAARIALLNKEWKKSWLLQQAQSEQQAQWTKVQTLLDLIKKSEASGPHPDEQFLNAVRNQYLSHNLSLLELFDYFNTYKETEFLLIESRQEVLNAMAEMDIELE